jgi:hypothetical protein
MTFEHIPLKENPFRVTPSNISQEIIWAGFPTLKKDIEKRIKFSSRFSNSNIVLNWGEYGSGKTHAANYFTQKSILQNISGEGNVAPFSIKITLPKGKSPVSDLFTNVIDFLDIKDLRGEFDSEKEDLKKFIQSWTNNNILKAILSAIFLKDDIKTTVIKSYLYGTISNSELKELNEYNILRKINGDEDYIKLLSGIFSCLSFDKKIYSSVVLWIDEFEDISLLNNSNINKLNNFVREIINNTPNHFLLFINFTASAMINVEDLSAYLSEAVISRIRNRIEFRLPSTENLKLYLKEILNHFHNEETPNDYAPFTENGIDEVIDVLGNASLRAYNEAFSILLEIAEFNEVSVINRDFIIENKDEFKPWK